MVEFYDFIYLSRDRIESWFSQLNGEVIKESKSTTSKGGEVTGKVGIEIGNLLAKLGLAKANANGEGKANYSTLLETTKTLSLENKVIILKNYLMDNGQIREINLSTAEHNRIAKDINSSKYQILTGDFVQEDISFDRQLYKSILKNGSGYPLVEIPIIIPFTQNHQRLSFTSSAQGFDPMEVSMKISAMVQCIERDGKFIATPLAIWLAY
jgi:hypothetical protein